MSIAMRVSRIARSARHLAAVLMLLALALNAGAQDQDEQRQPAALLEDFIHYVAVAKPDLALAYGQELLESGVTGETLAELVDSNDKFRERFDFAVQRGLVTPELEAVTAEIAQRTEAGRLALSRDPQRIDEAIGMLTGTMRQQDIARKRLEAAGEHAVPKLLERITGNYEARTKLEAERMLRGIKAEAVLPLSVALPNLDPVSQRIVAEAIGVIGYPHAEPFLLEVAQDEQAPQPVREAAERALRNIRSTERDLSQAYTNLARDFFLGRQSLIANPQEQTNNIWSYDAHLGLLPTPVPTEIYTELMAMRMADKAVDLNPQNQQAVVLFVAADLKRENDLSDGVMDPLADQRRYSPEFYATVFGTDVCLDVLAMAIDTTDTPLIRDAIRALAKTTGGSNLFANGNDQQPLLSAISYPDRRVQYEAALTLARALPTRGFSGDHRVVPLLASAVRTGNQQFALVVADDEENRRQQVTQLEEIGYTVVGADSSVGALNAAIADAPAIDLVVVRMNTPAGATQAETGLRRLSRTSATPVLIIASGVDQPGLRQSYRANPRVAVERPGVEFEAVVNELMDRAVGGRLTDADAEIYAIEALSALRDIAISGTPAYSVNEAEGALLDALLNIEGGRRLLVADVLALIDSDQAQRALFDAALQALDQEQIDLLERVAESVKRFGDRAEERHVEALTELIETSGGETAEAAARVHGALNIQSPDAVRFIES